MINRCRYPTRNDYKYYRGKGIRVCKRWEHSFDNFLEDMGSRPSKEHTIERIDSDGNYEPSNCCWATMYEQMQNVSSNKRFEFEGQIKTLSEWSRFLGIHLATLSGRINRSGMSFEDAVAYTDSEREVKYTHDGETKTLFNWASSLGISKTALQQRINKLNWPLEKALTEKRRDYRD
ncbi:hypothetical protein KAR91_37100 [Candidatus Pacearchaeota archaeon]|nr:hypothetical protein [Candidatus Pacearchaeota archaeon]